MMFIVIFVALLIERFFDWSHLRHWNWFTALQRHIVQRFPTLSPYLILFISIVPLLIIVSIVQYALSGVLYGFATLVFQIIVLLYCLGPKNLWADTFACINAMTQGDAKYASEQLKNSFGITESRYSQSLRRHLLSDIFIEANRRVFAIVFWFFILGPVGAVLYRAVTLSFTDTQLSDMAQSARSVEAVLDWVPVRLLTIIFALGGHFVQVLACWRKKAAMGLSSNETMLTECGEAALGVDEQTISTDGVTEKHAIGLLDRAFVITLVIVALLAFWS